jgi:hypothetical protein
MFIQGPLPWVGPTSVKRTFQYLGPGYVVRQKRPTPPSELITHP